MTIKKDNTFGTYGKVFQEKIMQALLSDPKWAEQLMEVFNVGYFDLKYLVYLADKYFSYAKKYKVFPSLQMLVTIIRDDLKTGSDALLREQIVDYLQRMKTNPDPGDLPGIKEKALDFCRKQALQTALETAVGHMESEKYEQIVEVVKKAVLVGTAPSVGHEFFEDLDARFTKLSRICVPTGIPVLDQKDILNGGLAGGELGCVVAATGVGKCVMPDTLVDIKVPLICIDGEYYRPWDVKPPGYLSQTSQLIASKFECMQISLGELFDKLTFPRTTLPNEENASTDLSSGDSLMSIAHLGIRVLSLDVSTNDRSRYQLIEAIRWTKPESHVILNLSTVNGAISIDCSPEHLVRIVEHKSWIMVKDLRVGDIILVNNQCGSGTVTGVTSFETKERLCDLQVASTHCYFANDILSHNSHFLTFLGANALRLGIDVVHYTFELSETSVGVRYDSNLCSMNSNLVIENQDIVREKYQDMKGLGRLFIKEYPTNSASIYTLRSHIERLQITKGFRPGLIVIDYADIMRSSRQFDSLRHELKLVYEELRGWASEIGVPIWTASQSNKEGANSDVVDLSNMSEAYGKAMVADVITSLSRKPQEKASGFGRLFMAKNRAGRDGIVWPVQIDTSMSNFTVLDQESSLMETQATDQSDLKAKIRERWEEIKRDKLLPAKKITVNDALIDVKDENTTEIITQNINSES